MLETVWRPRLAVDVGRTLGSLRRGTGDPTYRSEPGGIVWRTTRTPAGPATYRLSQVSPHEIHCAAWGTGAEQAIAAMPDLLGGRDDPSGFDPMHPLLQETHRRHPGIRIPRSGRVLEALVPAVLEQKVTGQEARSSWRWLLRRYGEPAPGPAPDGMRVPPPAEVWRRVPSWDWHRAGVDPRRAQTVISAARVAGRLEQSVGMASGDAMTRLTAVPGVGCWTAAEVAQRALGDADAVSVGDYHLPSFVGWALAGRPVDDDGMLELLERWRPQRYRAVRLLECSGFTMPRFGPRLTIQDHRAI